MSTPTKCRVLVRKLGKIRYSAALDLQQRTARTYKDNILCGEVLLCEHYPVFTFGLREKDYQTRVADLQKVGGGCEVVKVRRGGLTTFHGPGQLVCYPVLNLRKLKVGVKEYVRCLEVAVMETFSSLSIPSFTTCNTGVWVNHPLKGESKICAIGIQVSHGVAYHGLALNCNTDLSWYQHIVPCGIKDKCVTSLTELCDRTVLPSEVQSLLVRNLAQTLGFDVHNNNNQTQTWRNSHLHFFNV